ncbi:hypothetical protein [Pelagibius sp. Alg239-R121]|uniref:hypothetical protein n=1 Tax=Pelagibius sp. Alg239-R121 TaxID=2993448 RepID=UPI0024A6F9CD|nr:hypothetical protein [Pelagibius sp. Alg239-R121]
MASKSDIQWFKKTFYNEIAAATKNTIFDPDMLIAIATQETGSLWSPMRKKGLRKSEIVRLCCGDTLDAPNRSAFPKTKAHLVAVKDGDKMFDIARAALLAMSQHVPGYGFAKNRKNKFCHGYGVFQYDLQFFKVDPGYFLNKRYENFKQSLGKAMEELTSSARKRKLHNRSSITDLEFTTIAITYNTGRYRSSRGLKQGHFDGSKFYGEHIRDYIAIARSIPNPDGSSLGAPTGNGNAVVNPPAQKIATGPKMKVDVNQTSHLRMRSEAKISSPTTKNIVAHLPDDHPVRAFTGKSVNGFIEIEAELNGNVFRGFSSAKHLKKTSSAAVVAPPPLATGDIPEAHVPRKASSVTKRTQSANAFTVRESGMPSRTGGTPEELRKDLAQIISYLNPQKASHKRYQPRSNTTFCNIYAHDYCALAGVYLPRVWWTERAVIEIAKGEKVKPRYGSTLREMRANDIFRWLDDHGASFGWRRASSLTDVQDNANQGAVALIIARRKNEGRSGHVSIVVPETDKHAARRNRLSEVTAPLQSQAGSRNFNYSAGTTGWWNAEKFADSAFWFHP